MPTPETFRTLTAQLEDLNARLQASAGDEQWPAELRVANALASGTEPRAFLSATRRAAISTLRRHPALYPLRHIIGLSLAAAVFAAVASGAILGPLLIASPAIAATALIARGAVRGNRDLKARAQLLEDLQPTYNRVRQQLADHRDELFSPEFRSSPASDRLLQAVAWFDQASGQRLVPPSIQPPPRSPETITPPSKGAEQTTRFGRGTNRRGSRRQGLDGR